MDIATDFGGYTVALPKNTKVMSARQSKACRAVLGMSVAALAKASGVSESSIRRIEEGRPIKVDLVFRLQFYFEGRGFTFLWEPDGCGVKWTGEC